MSYKRLFKDKVFITSLAIFLSILLYGIIHIKFIAKTNPGRWYVVPKGLPPSIVYPFGTTLTGQNLIDVVFAALLNSFTIDAIAAAMTVVVTIILASVAVLLKRSAAALVTVADIIGSLPLLPILIVILYAWRDVITLPVIGLILGIFGWAWPSRALIALLAGLSERTFIYTSYLSGMPKYIIILRDFMPYILRYNLVNFINYFLWALSMETTAAMFGAMKMEIPTIGTTLFWAIRFQAIFLGLWWWYTIPIVFLILTLISLYVVGIKIDEYLITGKVM